MGALDQRVLFIENFTQKPKGDCLAQRMEFLKYLKDFLEHGDENMAHKSDKKSGGDDSSNQQPLLDEKGSAKPESTKGKLFNFFSKK